MNSPDSTFYFNQIAWDAHVPKYQTIIAYIKNGIINSEITGKLLSSRRLADIWKINRNTVVKALEELVWEGYLTAHPQKGLFINSMDMPLIKPPLQKVYNIPYKLANKQRTPAITTTATTKAIDPVKYTQYLLHFIKNKFTHPTTDIVAWVKHKFGIVTIPEAIGVVNSFFESNFIISRLLLESNDSILVSKNTKKQIVEHLPNLDIRLIPIPVKEQRLSLEKLKQIFEANKNIKFVYFHHLLDELVLQPKDILSIMELCYRYGVIIFENIVVDVAHLMYKCRTFKQYDYKHYVITCIHNQIVNFRHYSYIIAHQEIQNNISKYMNHLCSSPMDFQSIGFHTYLVQQPKLLSKIMIK
jgi:DNA-binding transcriptional MocR family regulator